MIQPSEKKHMTREEIEACWKDPHNWKWHVYYCKADPRAIVPRRLKWMGWTVNFARPSAIPWVGLCACDSDRASTDHDRQGCYDQYTARYRRSSHRCRVFAVCVVILAHKMMFTPPNKNRPSTALCLRPVSLSVPRWTLKWFMMRRIESRGCGLSRAVRSKRGKDYKYATKREEILVSSQTVWLGLGNAVRLARLGGDGGFAGACYWRSSPLWQSPPNRHSLYGDSWGSGDSDLLAQRGTATMALGQGLKLGTSRPGCATGRRQLPAQRAGPGFRAEPLLQLFHAAEQLGQLLQGDHLPLGLPIGLRGRPEPFLAVRDVVHHAGLGGRPRRGCRSSGGQPGRPGRRE